MTKKRKHLALIYNNRLTAFDKYIEIEGRRQYLFKQRNDKKRNFINIMLKLQGEKIC